MLRVCALVSLLNPTLAFSRDLTDAPPVFEDDVISLLQVQSHNKKHLSAALSENVQPPDEIRELKGNDLTARNSADSDGNMEFCDQGAGSFALDGYLTSARFYVQQAGSFGFRFRVYRPARGWSLVGQTEAIDMPQGGIIQEVTFSEPVEFKQGDYIGWSHDGRGQIPFDVGGAAVVWSTSKNDEVGAARWLPGGQSRTYSYEVTASREVMIARALLDESTNLEVCDQGAGFFSGDGWLIRARFYVQRAGNFGFRFRIYRPAAGWKLIGQTEALDMPQAGVVRDVTFSEPVEFQRGDYIGWSHDGKGQIPFQLGGQHRGLGRRIVWQENKNDDVGSDRHLGKGEDRTYSYEVYTSPDRPTTTTTEVPELDEAAAEADPHLKQLMGGDKDLDTSDLQ